MKEGNSYFLKDEYEGIVAFSIKEVARMLQLPPSTISLYCKEGLLPCFKVGRHYRIAKTDLIRFIDEAKDECITNKHLPPPPPQSLLNKAIRFRI